MHFKSCRIITQLETTLIWKTEKNSFSVFVFTNTIGTFCANCTITSYPCCFMQTSQKWRKQCLSVPSLRKIIGLADNFILIFEKWLIFIRKTQNLLASDRPWFTSYFIKLIGAEFSTKLEKHLILLNEKFKKPSCTLSPQFFFGNVH